jgi:hypothetical protein
MSVAVTAGDLPTGAVDYSGDIVGKTPGDWLVIGWFTPDYRPVAEKLAASLIAHGAPFHLMAKPKLGKGWNTLRKPSVVLELQERRRTQAGVLADLGSGAPRHE